VAYLAEQGDRPIGFALVRGLEHDARVMGEFFVVRSARRSGVARAFAEHVVRSHPGRWEIAFQEDNVRAARFWRRLGAEVLHDVTEEARPVPDKPHIPPDRWLTGTTPKETFP
jgi:predicted acetyltransferase